MKIIIDLDPVEYIKNIIDDIDKNGDTLLSTNEIQIKYELQDPNSYDVSVNIKIVTSKIFIMKTNMSLINNLINEYNE